jgi:hypothetical protein
VGRKDPRVFLCVCPGERCKKQLWNLFSFPRQGSAPIIMLFVRPGRR